MYKDKIWRDSVEGEGSTFTFSTPTLAKDIYDHHEPGGIFEGAGI